MKFFLGLSIGLGVGALGYMYLKIDAIHHNVLELHNLLGFLQPQGNNEQGCTCPSEN